MNERFSNDLLFMAQRAAGIVWPKGFEEMRKVLEEYLTAYLKHIILSIEPASLADAYSEDDDIISRTDVMEALGLLPKALKGSE